MYSRTWLFWQIIRAHIKGDGYPAAAHAHRKTDMATPLLGWMIDTSKLKAQSRDAMVVVVPWKE